MCGISAIFGDVEKKEENLRLSLSKISHRGDPNHQFEHRIFDHAALGANRLAIVDEKLGSQPQGNERADVFALLNGEIFNYKDLIEKLATQGHTFRTQSDTETLVHLWEEHGEKLTTKLDSEMFAFVIYDKKNDEMFAARDRIGVKPLYYAFDAINTIYFASEIKALVCLENLKEIHEFPPGHYFYKGEFVRYYETAIAPDAKYDEAALSNAIEEAVKKRVQTELPIAVFLSGGVDSSLVMELATRFHNDVTALILGELDSPDYLSATKLCEEKHWKYKTVQPEIDYKKELPDVIYYVEAYDPNIVRHSFANDAISKLAHKLGFKIVLTGEGADEIFAGYNEFLSLDLSKINLGCKLLLDSMSKGNLMRIDKMAMRHTVEIRCPFFDQNLVNMAMSVNGLDKIGEHDGKKFTKFIFRKIAIAYIPERIAWREKMPFANGAGMNVGANYRQPDGVFAEIAENEVSDQLARETQDAFPEYALETKEEVLFFNLYRSFKFNQFIEGEKRLIVKDTLLTI